MKIVSHFRRSSNRSAVTFPIDGFARQCLLEGVDELGYLLAYLPRIVAYEESMPDAVRTV